MSRSTALKRERKPNGRVTRQETQRIRHKARDKVRDVQDTRSEMRRETQCTRHTKARDETRDAKDTRPETRRETQHIRHKAKRGHDGIDDEIQVGNNSEPRSSKFISFSLLIGKLSRFQ